MTATWRKQAAEWVEKRAEDPGIVGIGINDDGARIIRGLLGDNATLVAAAIGVLRHPGDESYRDSLKRVIEDVTGVRP